MTAQNFKSIMSAIYTLEGGFSNDPRDPGGITMHGVTAASWAAWLRVPLSTITAAQMAALTTDDTDPFYRAMYWNIVDGNSLPGGVDAMLMHMAVNAGEGVAGRELQAIVGVVQDAQIGPKTLGAVETYIQYAGVKALIQAIASAQLSHYMTLPGWVYYHNGWTNRVNAIEALAQKLAAA